MKRWSSLRRTEAPIPVALMVGLLWQCFWRRPLLCGFLPATFAHGFSTRGDRLDDVVVAGAAAEIALKLVADGVVVEVVPLTVDDVDGRHDHARRAVAALQAVVLAKSFLHRMQRAVRFGQALNRGDVGAIELPSEHGAGLHRLAVDVDYASTALRGI